MILGEKLTTLPDIGSTLFSSILSEEEMMHHSLNHLPFGTIHYPQSDVIYTHIGFG